MKITDSRLAALAINANIAEDRTIHKPLSAESQQAFTKDIRETLAKIDAEAGGLRGLFILAVGDTETMFAVNASDAACATRLAVTVVDKGMELAEEIAQENAADLLQRICNDAELMAYVRKELRLDD